MARMPARVYHKILGKIDGMGVRIAPQENQDSVLEHGQALLRNKAETQTVEVLREIVIHPG